MVEKEDRADVLLITGRDVASDTIVLVFVVKEIATLALEPADAKFYTKKINKREIIGF